MKRNYYEILGIDQYSDSSTVKKAYKGLALKYHPDKSLNPIFHQTFNEIREAYETLSNPELKSSYDKTVLTHHTTTTTYHQTSSSASSTSSPFSYKTTTTTTTSSATTPSQTPHHPTQAASSSSGRYNNISNNSASGSSSISNSINNYISNVFDNSHFVKSSLSNNSIFNSNNNNNNNKNNNINDNTTATSINNLKSNDINNPPMSMSTTTTRSSSKIPFSNGISQYTTTVTTTTTCSDSETPNQSPSSSPTASILTSMLNIKSQTSDTPLPHANDHFDLAEQNQLPNKINSTTSINNTNNNNNNNNISNVGDLKNNIFSASNKGQSIYSTFKISFEESVEGCHKSYLHKKLVSCPNCLTNKSTSACSVCHGKSTIVNQQFINVYIPPGVNSGYKQVFNGLGNVGENGTAPGDLILCFDVPDHPNFKREGDDVWGETTITMIVAVLGGRITVPFLYGTMDIDINAGTQPGQILKIKEQGFTNVFTKKKGDFFLKINVSIPKTLSPRQYAVLREFSKG